MTQFEKLVREIFGFLETEFHARLTDREKDSWNTYLTYRNETTAVRISLEPHERGIFLRIIRLREGELPENPIFFNADAAIDWYDLRDIVLMKDARLKLEVTLAEASFEPPEAEMRKILEAMSSALREHCADVLNGDFRILEKLEPFVKKRASEVRALSRSGQVNRASIKAVIERFEMQVRKASEESEFGQVADDS